MNSKQMKESANLVLKGIEEDVAHKGPLETPDRIVKMHTALTAGYTDNATAYFQRFQPAFHSLEGVFL